MSEQALILARIMKRTGINPAELPKNLEDWANFLDRINTAFNDFEQERYLLERSMEISSREMQELNTNLETTRTSMISMARRAGMSEIATTILHNVGNILNSAYLSISIIDETIQNIEIQNIDKISQMLKDNVNTKDYLLTDKGKLIPDYLAELYKSLQQNIDKVYEESKNLSVNIDHIKNIVAMQKNVSGVAGLTEKVHIPDIIDEALRMTVDTKKDDISIIKKYEYNGFIYIDKTKLLQILVNLIKNANEAVKEKENNTKKLIELNVNKNIDNYIEINVIDNGVGIDKDNLTKIFSMGFTTKSTGHGFGLHSSALTAKELAGNLKVESRGKDAGATFTLTIPCITDDSKP